MNTRAKLSPLRVGSAAALTVVVTYILCTAAWAIWQEPALDFLNALFHGLDFRRILVPHREYGAWLFLYPLLVMPIAAFVVGSVFALFSNSLGGLGRSNVAK